MYMWEWKRERKMLKKLKVEPNVSLTFGGLNGGYLYCMTYVDTFQTF